MVVYCYVDFVQCDLYLFEMVLSQVCEWLVFVLNGVGVVVECQSGEQIYVWLLCWFNFDLQWVEKEVFYCIVCYYDNLYNVLLLMIDFSEFLWFMLLCLDVENGVWWFDEQFYWVVIIDCLCCFFVVGYLIGEICKGDNINVLMDFMLEGIVMCMIIVVQVQDVLEECFIYLVKNVIGENVELFWVWEDVVIVKLFLGEWYKFYYGSMMFLLMVLDLLQFQLCQCELNVVLLNVGLQFIWGEYEVVLLNGYLCVMLMCFNLVWDKYYWYICLIFVQYLVNLLLLFGWDIGIGNLGFIFFNCGGVLFMFDLLNSNDCIKNVYMVIFGLMGFGKLVMFNSLFFQLMVIYWFWLFIVEVGNSFGLFVDYCGELGLMVNKISIKLGCGIFLVLFVDVYKLIEQLVVFVSESEFSDGIDIDDVDGEEDGDEECDILGELEIVVCLMIIGGEEKEEVRLECVDCGMMCEVILVVV